MCDHPKSGRGEHLLHDLLVEVVKMHVHQPGPALAQEPWVPVPVVERGEGVNSPGDQPLVDLPELLHRIDDMLEDVPRADDVERLGVGGDALGTPGDRGDLQPLSCVGRSPDRWLDPQDVEPALTRNLQEHPRIRPHLQHPAPFGKEGRDRVQVVLEGGDPRVDVLEVGRVLYLRVERQGVRAR